MVDIRFNSPITLVLIKLLEVILKGVIHERTDLEYGLSWCRFQKLGINSYDDEMQREENTHWIFFHLQVSEKRSQFSKYLSRLPRPIKHQILTANLDKGGGLSAR